MIERMEDWKWKLAGAAFLGILGIGMHIRGAFGTRVEVYFVLRTVLHGLAFSEFERYHSYGCMLNRTAFIHVDQS